MPDPVQPTTPATPPATYTGPAVTIAPQTPAAPAAPAAAAPAASAAPLTGDDKLLADLERMLDAHDAEVAASIEPTPAASPGQATPVAAAPPAPVNHEPAQAPSISDAMLERARSAGISPEEARAYDLATLERTVAIFERNWAAVAEHMAKTRTATTPAPTTDPATTTPPAGQPEAKPEGFQIGLDERLYDPEVVKTLKAMNDHYAGEMKALKEKLGKVDQIEPLVANIAQETRAKAEREFVSNLEGWVGGLGEDFKEVLGVEPFSKLQKGTPAHTEHLKIAQQMDILSIGAQAVGVKLSAKEAFDQSVKLLYGDRAAEKARVAAAARVAQQLRDQRGQFVQRPSESHSPDTQDPRSAAIAELSDLLRRERNGVA